MTASQAPSLATRGLGKVYELDEGAFSALDDVSVTIDRGEFVAIMGPSGSGKSTLLYLLGCLDRPSSGSLEVGGTPVHALDDFELSRLRCREIGFVFQSFHLLPTSTIWENVQLPMVYARVEPAERRRRAALLLEAVGLGTRLSSYPRQLSGGQCQRVAIARALANWPSVLLADEPTGNLDSRTGRDIMRLFAELNDLGLTIAMVTHDPQIARHASRLLEVMDGRIVESRPVPDRLRETASDQEASQLRELLGQFMEGVRRA